MQQEMELAERATLGMKYYKWVNFKVYIHVFFLYHDVSYKTGGVWSVEYDCCELIIFN